MRFESFISDTYFLTFWIGLIQMADIYVIHIVFLFQNHHKMLVKSTQLSYWFKNFVIQAKDIVCYRWRCCCSYPKCAFQECKVETRSDQHLVIKVLDINGNRDVNGNSSKQEKPKRPILPMWNEGIEWRDQAALKHFEYYNKLVVISGQAVSHISECMSPEFFKVVPC